MTETALRPTAGVPRPYRFPAFHRQHLAGGMEVITAPVTKLPLVSVVALFDAGATQDPPDKEGLALLTARLLLEGTERLDGAELTDAFEQLGATADANVDWDSATITITVLRPKAQAALSLLAEVIRSPAFRDRDLARLKAERQAERMQMRTEPRELADESFEHFLYAPTSRYARSAAGSVQSVAHLTREDVLAFYRARYAAAGLTLIVVGDVDRESAGTMAAEAFDGWSGDPLADRASKAQPAGSERRVQIVAKSDAPQSELRIGHLGVPRSHPDYFPLVVLNSVLGGLFSSRINLNLRERHGYAYGARSEFDWRRDAGPFLVSTAVESGVTAAATREVLVEIERIREAPITADELSLATSFLEGVFPIRFETTTAIARALAALVTYRYPPGHFDAYREGIRAVTAEDVLRVARHHLHPEALLVVAVGDPEIIKQPMAELEIGPVHVALPEDVEPGA